jgi:L-ascorbate metabolism protein UlaG (beta-lactamase superfamily)
VDGSTAIGVRWLGHACVQIELGGVRVLTDPALTTRLGHLRRHHRIDAGALEPPDAILISHVHLDHLHVPSLRAFARSVPIIVPSGAGPQVRRAGFRDVREVRAGGTVELGALQVETVPAVHPSTRGPFSRVAADAVGYVLRAAGAAVYFPGDTDLFDEMGTWAPIDVALLPIGGWGRTVGEGHLDPVRAVAAAELVQPRLVVPVHWGTYSPIGLRRPGWLDEPARRFEAELVAAGAGELLRVLNPGDGLVLPPDGAVTGAEVEG